jgi:UDP-glucose 4-epimerase
MKRTVLVTGGQGYIGGRVCAYLVGNAALSITATTTFGNSASRSVPGVALTHLDLTDSSSMRRACAGVNVVVHLASPNEIVSGAEPERAMTETGLGTLMLLNAAIDAGVERFIYFSTAHVYGAPLQGRIDEMTLPRPVHPYAIAHRVAEDWVLAAHNAGKLIGIVLRLTNAVGAPDRAEVDRWTLLSGDLCRQAVEKGELTLRSSGSAQRDFIPLSDVARAVGWAIESPSDLIGNGLFNLGGANTLRVLDLAEMIQRRCDALFSFRPAISRPSSDGSASGLALAYRIDKITQCGFRLTGSLENEIDATLRLCQNSFARTSDLVGDPSA